MIVEGTTRLVQRDNLSHYEAKQIMTEIMSGAATEAQIAAFLTALRMKGETVEEIVSLAMVMREFCSRIRPNVQGRLVDTCGTGGDRIKTFNVSTISALVVAGAGIPVAKHGNRSVTSRSGSADVLEKLGLNLNLEPEAVEKVIEKTGIGFMFAPKFHPAMKYALGPRREMGIRTVFNILGPLANPAGAKSQIVGVYGKEWVEPLATVLRGLGCEEAMVVHGIDGLDEISIIGKTKIARLRYGSIQNMMIEPKDFGFRTAKSQEVKGGTPEWNAEITFKILNTDPRSHDPRRDMVLLNSAAGIVVGGGADSMTNGIELATESIRNGSAYKKLKTLIAASHGETSRLEELEQKYA